MKPCFCVNLYTFLTPSFLTTKCQSFNTSRRKEPSVQTQLQAWLWCCNSARTMSCLSGNKIRQVFPYEKSTVTGDGYFLLLPAVSGLSKCTIKPYFLPLPIRLQRANRNSQSITAENASTVSRCHNYHTQRIVSHI
jgi:hypothetical protein